MSEFAAVALLALAPPDSLPVALIAFAPSAVTAAEKLAKALAALTISPTASRESIDARSAAAALLDRLDPGWRERKGE